MLNTREEMRKVTADQDEQAQLSLELLRAAESEWVYGVKRFIVEGADPNYQSAPNEDTALIVGIKYLEIVKILLKNGANPNLRGSEGFTPLFHAIQYGVIEVVKVLLDHGNESELRQGILSRSQLWGNLLG